LSKSCQKCQKVVKIVKKFDSLGHFHCLPAEENLAKLAQKLFFATMREKSANVTFCHNNAQKELPKS
jgi:hypothetical protein